MFYIIYITICLTKELCTCLTKKPCSDSGSLFILATPRFKSFPCRISFLLFPIPHPIENHKVNELYKLPVHSSTRQETWAG